MKREEEFPVTLLTIDEESAGKANAQKIQRELELQFAEMQENILKLQQESDTIESQLSEWQQLLEEKTRQKLALSSKLREIESEKNSSYKKRNKSESSREKMTQLTFQMLKMKKKADKEGKLMEIF